jgi:hypothetical protein
MHSQAGGSAILNTPSGVVQEEAGEVLSYVRHTEGNVSLAQSF